MNGRKIFAFHSILGLITGALLLVISLSGSVLVFSKEIDQQINPTLVKVVVGKEKTSLAVFTGMHKLFFQTNTSASETYLGRLMKP